jgi:hypothetical protein
MVYHIPMSLKESCISSFFIHVVAVLAVLAVSQYHSKMPVNNLVVTLSREKSAPLEENITPVKQDLDSRIKEDLRGEGPQSQDNGEGDISADEDSARDEAPAYRDSTADTDSSVQHSAAEHSQRDENMSESPKETEVRETPEGFVAGVSEEFLRVHTMAFAKKTGLSIQSFVQSGMINKKGDNLDGAYARVKLHYDKDGALNTIEVLTNSDTLNSILEHVSWTALPSPSTYFLQYRSLDIRIAIVNGYPFLYVAAL